MNATRQQIDFKLFRSGQLNGNEMAVLSYINTYSQYCYVFNVETVARDVFHWSGRKLRYVIQSLADKGLIKKSYRCFKKLHLEIVTLAEQAKLRGPGMVKAVLRKASKVLHKDSNRKKHAELIRQSVSEPKTEGNQENKTSSIGLNFGLKTLETGNFDRKLEFLKQMRAAASAHRPTH